MSFSQRTMNYLTNEELAREIEETEREAREYDDAFDDGLKVLTKQTEQSIKLHFAIEDMQELLRKLEEM